MTVPKHTPELGMATDVPAIGGCTQGGMANSYAPISGVVVLLLTSSISDVIPTGVPPLSSGDTTGVKLKVTNGSAYTGSRLMLCASCVVAACQSARVTRSVPSYPTKAWLLPPAT